MTTYKPVFLWGMPGVGKSTFGKRIANQLDWSWIDLDILIAQKQNTSISEIVAKKGEAFFRELEEKSLLEIKDNKNTIISCGGGTPAYYDNANKMLAAGLCVYLEADVKFISSRIYQSKQERFLFQRLNLEDLNLKIENLLNERKSYFENAHLHIKLPIFEVSAEIDRLKKHLKMA